MKHNVFRAFYKEIFHDFLKVLCWIYFCATAFMVYADVSKPAVKLKVFIEQHCIECHDDDITKGDLNLLDFNYKLNDLESISLLGRIYDRVQTGEMPPPKKRQPHQKEKHNFLTTIIGVDIEYNNKYAQSTSRRLSNREYENTLRDLIGSEEPLKELLPIESDIHDFDTNGLGQQLSHHFLKKYYEVADTTLSKAFNRIISGDEDYNKFVKTFDEFNFRGGKYRRSYAAVTSPQFVDGKNIYWQRDPNFYGRIEDSTVPYSGWYRITLKDVEAVDPNKNGVVWGTLKSGMCAFSSPKLHEIGLIEATVEKRDITYKAWMEEGHMLQLKPNDFSRNIDRSKAYTKPYYMEADLLKKRVPGIAITGIKMERIFPYGRHGQVTQNLLGKVKPQDFIKSKNTQTTIQLLKQCIQHFTTKAFRRPIKEGEVQPYYKVALDYYNNHQLSWHESLKIAYSTILCSPYFLNHNVMASEYASNDVASKLSYTLWGSMPDFKLLQAAKSGALLTQHGFKKEFERLLNDKKFNRFIVGFVDQWVDLEDIENTSPDRKLYKSYDSIIQQSMVLETRSFISELIKNDLSIRNIIDSKMGFLNERLIRHYGLKGVKFKPGEGLQKVNLSKQSRSGLLTQGAVLKVTANGTTTSPVVRGVWVYEKILGKHLPPPPSNVPAIEPDIRGAISIRDQLKKHSHDESCASCHKKIDPAGYALENFNPVGAWRDYYGNKKDRLVVDSSGITELGEAFKNIEEWKNIYLKHPEKLAFGFLKNFFTYATGKIPSISEQKNIKTIVKSMKGRNYGLRSMMYTLVSSDLFLK